MIKPLPPQALKRLGAELARVVGGALEHADLPSGWEPDSFDREARALLAEFERRHGASVCAAPRAEDPA